MTADQAKRSRLRDLGVTIGVMLAGAHNAVTDVPGVRVGHSTIIEGDNVRTGVTAVHPLEGSAFSEMPPAAIQILNGAGEITGRSQVDEYGLLESPIMITNTLSVGTAHRGCIEWMRQQEPTLGPLHFSIPVVAETYDSFLNDIGGQHVTIEHVFDSLDSATGGPVAEGNVGGGTGMMLFGFKGGIGTSSRLVTVEDREYTVGVLVQGNFGIREHLLVDGVPVGREITDLRLFRAPQQEMPARDGSIIVVIATDAPLSDRQLARLCRRGMLGLGQVGSTATHGSGDLLVAFSNAPECRVNRFDTTAVLVTPRLDDRRLDPFFQATVEATAESVLNALVAAEDMTGRDGNRAHALPHDRLMEVMRKYGRLAV
ncbi:P1 family peptidase [soil metagenome]